MPPETAFTFDENISRAGDEILSQMPDVQEHAIAAHEDKQNEAQANVETDKDGVPYDPALHTGSRLKDGTWRKRKNPGNPGSVVAPSRKRNSAPAIEAANATAATNAEAIATGTVVATMFLGACQSIGGEEWEPSEQERDFQTAAWQAYCVAKNYKELSPGFALFVALGSYAGPRLAKPKTAEKIGKAKTWILLRVAKWKLKRALKKSGIEATVTIKTGADGVPELHVNGKPHEEE